MNTILEQHQLHNFSLANRPFGQQGTNEAAQDLSEAEMVIPPLTVEMTRDDFNMIQSFKPYIENSTPQQKADFLQKTIFKPRKRILKLLTKRNELKELRLKDKEYLGAKQPLRGARSIRNGNGGQEAPSDVLATWPQDLPLGEHCPVYKCSVMLAHVDELEQHFKEAHNDLMQLGLSVSRDETGKVVGNVKDTLLSQLMVFMLTNKCQIKRFMIDHEDEEAEMLRNEITKLTATSQK